MIRKINKVIAGYVLAFSLVFVSTSAMAATIPGKIVGTDIKIRKAPNISAGIITKLSNSSVSVVDKSNGWYKISFNKKIGWVNDDYLKLLTTKGTINANGVNFRVSGSTKGKVISTLKKQTSVEILDTIKGWNKVKIGSKVGYVASKFVTAKNITSTAKASRSMNALALDISNENSVESKVVNYAKEFVGVNYVYGGNSPHGFDCSGFIGYVYKNFGVNLNRSAEGMYSNGTRVSKSELKAGDLLFFDASSRKASGAIDHAGIYLGGDRFIHASSSNGEVRIQKLSEYRGTYIGAKRVI